jgi:hypothetical protein
VRPVNARNESDPLTQRDEGVKAAKEVGLQVVWSTRYLQRAGVPLSRIDAAIRST